MPAKKAATKAKKAAAKKGSKKAGIVVTADSDCVHQCRDCTVHVLPEEGRRSGALYEAPAKKCAGLLPQEVAGFYTPGPRPQRGPALPPPRRLTPPLALLMPLLLR